MNPYELIKIMDQSITDDEYDSSYRYRDDYVKLDFYLFLEYNCIVENNLNDKVYHYPRDIENAWEKCGAFISNLACAFQSFPSNSLNG